MGQIRCTDFINKFIGMGMEERASQKQKWRQHQKEADERRKKEEVCVCVRVDWLMLTRQLQR